MLMPAAGSVSEGEFNEESGGERREAAGGLAKLSGVIILVTTKASGACRHGLAGASPLAEFIHIICMKRKKKKYQQPYY